MYVLSTGRMFLLTATFEKKKENQMYGRTWILQLIGQFCAHFTWEVMLRHHQFHIHHLYFSENTDQVESITKETFENMFLSLSILCQQAVFAQEGCIPILCSVQCNFYSLIVGKESSNRSTIWQILIYISLVKYLQYFECP